METQFIERGSECLPPYRIMTCECGEKHDSRGISIDFDCTCGQLYNAFGQKLENLFGNGDEPYWAEDEMN